MSLELEGKVALVTGASRGIGRAIAVKLASLGAKVAVNYRTRADAAKSVVDSILSSGGEAVPLPADVRDSDAVKAMVQAVTDRWERIDILVNNAGINRDTLLLKMSDEVWDDVINSNLRGTYLCTKFALRSMMRQRWGRIVNITSIAGIMGNPGQANYSASKGGIIAFTKSVAKEVGSLNITANAIAPGFITTEMTDSIPQEMREIFLQMTALKRFGSPEEVAELAAFLASDRASFVTAQVIAIDGGV